ncbi:MAG: ribokinase [Alphaproteobacteria bacterium]|nr:ribokinase [Alphaproteobacteria bacterium]
MTVFNMGSINIDHIYTMPHLVMPGETLSATSYQAALGGKGANQSIAIARAGGTVVHGGMINKADENWLDAMAASGVNLDHVLKGEAPTGHAIVAVDDAKGENQIILSPSSNALIPDELTDAMLAKAGPGDWALAQNETNATERFLTAAKAKGLSICYSAAPFVAEQTAALLPLVDVLIVNAIEAEALENHLGADINVPHLIITKGGDGASYRGIDGAVDLAAEAVVPVDTPGAGVTYLGYILAGLDGGMTMTAAMTIAGKAAALQVTRHGASAAIPLRAEIE